MFGRLSVKLWSCNFNSQLANALIIEGDYQSSIAALESGYICAAQISYPELQVLFSVSNYLYFGFKFLFRFFKLGHTVIHFVLKLLFYFYVLLDSAFISAMMCDFTICCCLFYCVCIDVLCNFHTACAPHAMGR